MSSPYEIGQKVEVDLFGLRVRGPEPDSGQAIGTIVAMGPGTITVRIDPGDAESAPEVTVSPGRLRV